MKASLPAGNPRLSRSSKIYRFTTEVAISAIKIENFGFGVRLMAITEFEGSTFTAASSGGLRVNLSVRRFLGIDFIPVGGLDEAGR